MSIWQSTDVRNCEIQLGKVAENASRIYTILKFRSRLLGAWVSRKDCRIVPDGSGIRDAFYLRDDQCGQHEKGKL